MKKLITKEELANAIAALKAAEKKPTISAIHAALGNKGSLTTIIKLKAEIDADAVVEQDSEEGLRTFRELWALAVEEGRKQKETELGEMREAVALLGVESQSLEGEVVAARERVAQVEAQRDSMVEELARANQAVTAARAAGEQHATKFADALERLSENQAAHAAELAALRGEVAMADSARHHVELQLARAEERETRHIPRKKMAAAKAKRAR